MLGLIATRNTRAPIVAVIAAHALLAQCAYAQLGDNFAPTAENGWTLSERPPQYADARFTSGHAVVALDFLGLDIFTTIGPVVPIVPLGQSDNAEPLKFRVWVKPNGGPIDVDPRGIRFVEPCGPGASRTPDGSVAVAHADIEVFHEVAVRSFTSEKIAVADLTRPISLKAKDTIVFWVLMKADRKTIARCTMRFDGLFPNQRGARVPDAVFVRIPA